ncbi:24033_t:CDS:1, partial [Gigaspora margarita]
KIFSELNWEYTISSKNLNIDKLMQNIIPLHIIDININNSAIFAMSNNEIHINDEE